MKLRPPRWVIDAVLVILCVVVIWLWWRYILPEWIWELDNLR